MFTFLPAVTKVSVNLILKNIVHEDKDLMQHLHFHQKLAWLFIENELMRDKAEMVRLVESIGDYSHNYAPVPYFDGSFMLLRSTKRTSAKEKDTKIVTTVLALVTDLFVFVLLVESNIVLIVISHLKCKYNFVFSIG